MDQPVSIAFPDWKQWLEAHSGHSARDRYDYQLHMAAAEWTLSSALDINRREDFVSLPLPNVDPFAHQVEDAILFFRRLQPRGMIADDVGLGKTITAGLIARELLERGRIESILVVCPRSLVDQWREELESKFSINAQAGVGTAFARLDQGPYWITSYNTARSRMAAIRARKFDLLILDESHALRNLFGTQQPPKVALEFEKLMRDDAVRYCLMLTATPIQNRLWDIFSLLEILKAPQPNPLGTPDQFRNRFIADQAARVLIPGTRDEFRRCLSQLTVRTRRRETNLLFPDREVKDQLLTPLPAEKEFFDRALEVLMQFPPLVQITHARTLMSSPWAAATAFEKAAEGSNISQQLRYDLLQLARMGREIRESAKIQAVVKLVQTSAKNGRASRIIVFTQRLETLRHLADALQSAGFGDQIAIMQGGEAGANRRAIRDFMADPPARPVLLSSDTGAVGLNLQAGNIVVNYDLPWNPMVIEQRIGRVQRLGQKAKNVIVYNLVLSGTIEERVVLRLMEKLSLFNQAIGEMEELLELCGYDEENRSLDQVIMELIRKAAEQKDIAEDLRRMEESRAAAEEKMREMREANERILESLRPRDAGVPLEGLEKPSPRLPLVELIKACMKRAGAEYREEDGRLFSRVSPLKYVEFLFERQPNGVLQDESFRVVIPGTRAFEHITKVVREQIAHHFLDATGVGLERVRANLEASIKPMGLVIDDIEIVQTDMTATAQFDLKVGAEVASDRYETILDLKQASAEDGIDNLMDSWEDLRNPDGTPFPKSPDKHIKGLTEVALKLESQVREQISVNKSIDRFCRFYTERYQEDLERLADHARERAMSLGFVRYSSLSSEAAVNIMAEKEPGIKSAFASLKLRWTPHVKIEPLGMTGLNYTRAEIKAYIRNRIQNESFPVRLRAVPLTGVLLTGIPGTEQVSEAAEVWCCPGGHVVPESLFTCCSVEECTTGACSNCVGRGLAEIPALDPCADCGALLCRKHRLLCAGCEDVICRAHAEPLSNRGGFVCARCGVTLDDGRRTLEKQTLVSAVSGRRGPAEEMVRSPLSSRPAFAHEMVTCEETGRQILPDEVTTCEITGKKVAIDAVEQSAVSGKHGLRSRMKHSEWSGRPCLPGEERICDETGTLLLPDEFGQCSQTGKSVRKDLLEEEAETGLPVLRRLLQRSNVSNKPILKEHLVQSEISDRHGLPAEMIKCEICGNHILADEVACCPETGKRGCPAHYKSCEVTGVPVLDEGLALCEVTGRRVRRSLLSVCPETGKLAMKELFERCQESGVEVLREGLSLCSVTGRRVRKSLLTACQESGQPALPESLAICSVSGKLVRPDLLITCPETGTHLLPAHAVACEEIGTLVNPAGLATCAKTGKRVRRSLLSADDITGQLVLSRLLVESSVSARRTLPENMMKSEVSGKLALRVEMEQCEETGRWALPGELERCAKTGRRVLPGLLITCPETKIRLLERVAERCDVSGVLVSQEGLAPCEATGKRVRESLLGVDQVSGQVVQRTLLRECEKTGLRTLVSNLVRSAASGKLILKDISTVCEETGAPALREELDLCAETGKRVLPELLAHCEVSGRQVLRRLLRKCDITGKAVLPELLIHCRRSGKDLLPSVAGVSDVSGELGHPAIITKCEISGRKAFPDELLMSAISGSKIARDRATRCSACDRVADLSEMNQCFLCRQGYCRDDYHGDSCSSCGSLLAQSGGRDLTASEIALVRRKRRWVRNGKILESPGLAHLRLSGGFPVFGRRSSLLVVKREKEESMSRQLENPLMERPLDQAVISKVAKFWKAV